MLNGTLALHDIRDVEAFCKTIAEGPRRQHDPNHQEDLIAYLIATCWELSTKTPQPWRDSFAGWVTPILKLRVNDHLRQRDGRTRWTAPRSGTGTQYADIYERPRPILTPLDPHTRGTMDTEVHRSPDLMRLLRTRDRTSPQPHTPMGTDQARKAA